MTALHSEQVGKRFTKASAKRIRFLKFSRAFVLASIQKAGRTRARNQEFSSVPQTLRFNLRTGRQ